MIAQPAERRCATFRRRWRPCACGPGRSLLIDRAGLRANWLTERARSKFRRSCCRWPESHGQEAGLPLGQALARAPTSILSWKFAA